MDPWGIPSVIVRDKSQSVFGDMSLGGIYNSPGISDVEGSNPMHGSSSTGRTTVRQHLVGGSGSPLSASTSSLTGPSSILPKGGKSLVSSRISVGSL